MKKHYLVKCAFVEDTRYLYYIMATENTHLINKAMHYDNNALSLKKQLVS